MVICPYCNRAIERLITSATATDNAHIYEDGEICYPEEPEWELDYWECPECGEVVSKTDEEAVEFMKNTDELKKVLERRIKNG